MHSPGPWTWDDGEGHDMGYIRDAEGQPVCDFGNQRSYYPSEGNPPEREDRALILAAPDLLAALKAVVSVADRKTVEFDAARAAIAKAEGK